MYCKTDAKKEVNEARINIAFDKARIRRVNFVFVLNNLYKHHAVVVQALRVICDR